MPTDEATAKSVKNNSPTDSEKQTAVASKNKGTFFDQAFALSNTNNVSQDPAHCSIAHFTRDNVCLVCVCVCVCVSLEDTLITQTLSFYSRLTKKPRFT